MKYRNVSDSTYLFLLYAVMGWYPCSLLGYFSTIKWGSLQLSMVVYRERIWTGRFIIKDSNWLYVGHEPISYQLLVKLMALETCLCRTQQSKSTGLRKAVIIPTKGSCLQCRQHKINRESYNNTERAFVFSTYLFLSIVYFPMVLTYHCVHSTFCNSKHLTDTQVVLKGNLRRSGGFSEPQLS